MSSRFEFLGSTAIGQYVPRDSWFHQRDPRARLFTFIALFTGITFTKELSGIALGLLSVLLIFSLSKVPIKPALKGIRRALPFILFLAVLQILFGFRLESDFVFWSIFNLDITHRAAVSAMMLVIRFSILITLLTGFVMCLSTSQITAALHYLLKPFEKFKFPINDVTMIVQITLRFLPMIAQMAEKTAKAQAARGGDWEQRGFNPIRQAKRVIPLIVPIMVNSLRRAETMAMAMETRGFNAAEKRSSYYQLAFNWQDGALLGLASLSMIMMGLAGTVY